ncbi:MAG: hypothetical protein LBH04_00645 [Tannerellaceae bacterium]|nr:hypothetical protein [Tannerellaceae bacterium]
MIRKDMKDELEKLKGKNPFKTPDGYLDNLTTQIMQQLPERVFEEPRKVSLKERVLPWVYLAAVIAGLGLFFDLLKGAKNGDSNIVQNVQGSLHPATEQEENADYLEYLETQYANYMLAEEIEKFE